MFRLKRLYFITPVLLIPGARSYCDRQDINVVLRRSQITEVDVENYKKQYKTNTQLWNTSAHNDLIALLIYQSRSLVGGRFVGKNGIQSNLIQGPKGIGKSTVLESVTASKIPNLIPIYITYSHLNAFGSEVTQKSVMEIVLNKLPSNIRSQVSTDGILGSAISVALEKNNMFVFLIVDEIDQLYRVDSRMMPDLGKVAYTSIGDLAWLGDQKLGRFAIFICGSSANCPLLVTCNADKEAYPLVRGSPNLNGQKYQTHRLPVPIFTNIVGIKDVLTALGHDLSDEYARLVAFSVGAVPRALDEFVKKAETADPIYTTLRYKNHESALPEIDKSKLRSLEVSLMKEFKDRNGTMLKMISNKEGLIQVDLIASAHWEDHVVSLTSSDILRVWQRLTKKDEKDDIIDRIELQRLLFLLCDRGIFIFDGVSDGLPQKLYPMCPAQAFVDVLEPDALTTFANTFDQKIIQFSLDLAGKVSAGMAQGLGSKLAGKYLS